eukprot:gene5441-6120_t
MDSRSSFLSFIDRINDGYVSGLTINNLINDSEHQKLTIKSGKAIGTPLGNRHILPGYWFTVFNAPFESLDRVMECVRLERDQLKDGVKPVELWASVESLKKDFEMLLINVIPPLDIKVDSFPSKKPLAHIKNAIAHGYYDISELNGNALVTFIDYDHLCGYQFIASLQVTVFNRFASEFLNKMSELVCGVIEKHKDIASLVKKMFLKEMLR